MGGNSSNLADLNMFIKTLEKDLTQKFKDIKELTANTSPTTPNQILKKVEE